ncbi:Mce protein [Mycolicibacterium tokaiense]|jgi:Mce-associated membrane protein|uniref:Conserved Mce associated membrane protein n=1 Tax=Mycolicibacterium tokaiense TaxID=39695 RepID=A0A378TMH3_9MYCO|nr:Mce protein [Mycolicibacterium tokaiense]BBY84668.1 hypothetical protein MTOK_04500 [Mycolicibacterium tokaiense]STZ60826.1 conserved Mce associated membrane protein [Mycolicibacterium tokaiense]
MADDAAAPEGKLKGDPGDPETSEADEAPEGATESPRDDVEDSATSESEVEDFPETDGAETPAAPVAAKEPMSPVKLAAVIGVVVVLALGATVGWLGYRTAESRQLAEQRDVFLQVGRQAALNLTTIDVATVDADVQRILDSATDSFYDDFSSRTQPFVDVVRQAQSRSVGEVTSAGLESEDAEGAQVLVAITVRTSNVGAPEQEPRAWRMRISVKKVGEDTKVSNVEFVP